MDNVVIEIDGILETIIENPKYREIKEYTDILAETDEFSFALADLEKEITNSFFDLTITKNEIRKISVKMFKVLKILHDKNYKFKKSRNLTDLLRTHLEEILTVLVVKTIDLLQKHIPELYIYKLNEEDIKLIVGTIVDTAEWSIKITRKSWKKIFLCCG